MRVIAAVALAIALAASAACGGNGGGNSEGTSATAIKAKAQERAESIILKLSDFPDGWLAIPAKKGDPRGKRFRRCIGVDDSAFTILGDATSADFDMGEGTEASSNARVLRDDAQARDEFGALSKGMASARDCIQTLIPPLGKEFRVGNVKVSRLRFKPPDVDEARAWQIVLPVKVISGASKGDSATAYIDLVYLRKADVLVRMKALNASSPFDSELRTKLLQVVASRMSE